MINESHTLFIARETRGERERERKERMMRVDIQL